MTANTPELWRTPSSALVIAAWASGGKNTSVALRNCVRTEGSLVARPRIASNPRINGNMLTNEVKASPDAYCPA